VLLIKLAFAVVLVLVVLVATLTGVMLPHRAVLWDLPECVVVRIGTRRGGSCDGWMERVRQGLIMLRAVHLVCSKRKEKKKRVKDKQKITETIHRKKEFRRRRRVQEHPWENSINRSPPTQLPNRETITYRSLSTSYSLSFQPS
jgi:hypothetical protein